MNKYTDVKYFTTMQEIVEFAHANNMTEDWKIGEDDFGRGFYLYTFEEEKSTEQSKYWNCMGKKTQVVVIDWTLKPKSLM